MSRDTAVTVCNKLSSEWMEFIVDTWAQQMDNSATGICRPAFSLALL